MTQGNMIIFMLDIQSLPDHGILVYHEVLVCKLQNQDSAILSFHTLL